jgi:3-oxoacyl-[acyl-carrier-protein] synthase-1
MRKVYVSHNNIISSLGFTSEAVVKNIHNEVSGLQKINDKTILPEPCYTSLIPTKKLESSFFELNPKSDYTRLEQMMISSLSTIIEASNIALNARVGLIISTTKGNVDALDDHNPFHKDRAYLSELAHQVADFFNFKNDPIVVSNACVSGLLAVAVAKRFINEGVYDHVFITSGDVITEFILSGFNSFQALSNAPCKPFDKNRMGVNIGEVTASVLVSHDSSQLVEEAVEILGEGSCNDANHISGPSRTGEGLYRSMQSAFDQANLTAHDIDYISAHGTATSFNDEMEAIAFNRMHLNEVPLNSLKGYFGHSLGASGLVETIVGMHSLKNNTLYKSLGFENLGVSQPINVIANTTQKSLQTFLKTASGFGGCNTSILFQKTN